MTKLYLAVLMCAMMVLSGCSKKRYVSPLETPSMTEASEDAAYEFDFDQMNNDVIDSLQSEGIYSFVKDLAVYGDNDKKEISLEIAIDDNVSYDAVELLLTDATKAIVDEAHTQDFRIDNWDDSGFGNLFDLYSFKYKVTCGEETVRQEEIAAGESVPFDPTLNMERVVG